MERRLCSPQDNREKGENPLRSRRCISRARPHRSLGNREDAGSVVTPKSEDLPSITDGFRYER